MSMKKEFMKKVFETGELYTRKYKYWCQKEQCNDDKTRLCRVRLDNLQSVYSLFPKDKENPEGWETILLLDPEEAEKLLG